MATLGAGCYPAPSVRSLPQKLKHALDHFQDKDQKGEELLWHSSFSLLVWRGSGPSAP